MDAVPVVGEKLLFMHLSNRDTSILYWKTTFVWSCNLILCSSFIPHCVRWKGGKVLSGKLMFLTFFMFDTPLWQDKRVVFTVTNVQNRIQQSSISWQHSVCETQKSERNCIYFQLNVAIFRKAVNYIPIVGVVAAFIYCLHFFVCVLRLVKLLESYDAAHRCCVQKCSLFFYRPSISSVAMFAMHVACLYRLAVCFVFVSEMSALSSSDGRKD